MNNQSPFDQRYVGSTETARVVEQKSETKSFLKEPLKKEELERYGTSKPVRIKVRARLVHGNGKSK